MKKRPGTPILVTERLLRRWPLPRPDESGDKEERGRVLVVGGAPEMPGAVILAANAALRAGAGKLQIAVGKSVASLIAQAVPEAFVASLPETKRGALASSAAGQVETLAAGAGAVLVGPGMHEGPSVAPILRAILSAPGKAVLVLDAAALVTLADLVTKVRAFSALRRAILTPHAGEMAKLLGEKKGAIERDPRRAALAGARIFHAVSALKGPETFIADRTGAIYRNRAGNVGLATSGSGDTLSGIVAGLAARGAPPIQAAVWAVALHARAGDRLARRIGPLGFLPRELLAEIPALMAKLS